MEALSFFAVYLIGWVLYFQLFQRPVFIIYNLPVSGCREAFTPLTLLKIMRYGFKSDIISASYLSALPLLATIAQCYINFDFISTFMRVYNILAGVVIGIGVLSDTALYRFWKFKLDAFVLPYLKSVKGATASVTTTYIVTFIISLAVTIALTILWTQWLTDLTLSQGIFHVTGVISGFITAVAGLVLVALLVIFIRGLGRRPNNPSISFFSNHLFINHSSLNPIYSFIYSLSVTDKIEGAFHFTDDEVCSREFHNLYPADMPSADSLLRTKTPNVLFIIWESLSARFVGELGDNRGITPCIDRLAREGIQFSRLDCNSFRTDRGLVSLLSGYLAQPTTTVIHMSKKLPNLPAFPRKFKDLGYETTAIHGGDMNVFHMAEYFLTIGHDRIIQQSDMPGDLPSGKWGVHDGEVADLIYDDIMDKTACGVKWFTTWLTLSSHEPWIVPYSRINDDPVANTFAYTDSAIGKLTDRLRQTPAWDDLLIVITGDHGCNTGETIPTDKYAHIPLILTGGAVKGPRRIDTIMSQTDIAATILGQLDIPHKEFIFSRDVTAPSYKYPFSFHTFVNGFMFRDETGFTVYDNVSEQATDNPDADREHKGRIILQYLYDDLAKR